MTWKNIVAGISLIFLIVSGIVYYVYAESTESRRRDVATMAYVVSEDTALRENIHCNQIVQMAMLNDIKVSVSRTQTDVEYLKKSR